MLIYMLATFLIVIVFTVLILQSYKSNDTQFAKRKNQSSELFKGNIIRKRIEEITNRKVKASKRIRMEKMFIQAGYEISYSDYFIICLATSILFAGVFQFLMFNTFLAILFVFVGWLLPYQIILHKRNKRIEKMDMQIGPCLKMLIERYKTTKDMKKSIRDTAKEFEGEPPISKELDRLVIEMNLGKTVNEALEEFADRTGNQFMIRFADYYNICSEIGTIEVRDMLNHALEQYRVDRKNKLLHKKSISSVKSESYIVLAGVPFVALYQIFMTDGYVSFMTRTFVGQVGTAIVVTITMIAFWVINKKIGAPIEE